MAEERRNKRPSQGAGGGSRSGGPRGGGKPAAGGRGRPDKGGPKRSEGGAPGRSSRSEGSAPSRSSRSGERSERFDPRSDDRRDRRSGGRPERSDRSDRGDRIDRGGRPDRRSSAGGNDRPGRKSDWKRPADKQADRTAEQARYDGPDLPADITGKELDRAITAQLKGLPEKLAARVARHLAAAGSMIDDDPETAYQHTLAARARAPRLAVVREATGEAAYAAGHYAEALAELRAAKRMNGSPAYLPIMADCHRALGNPDQAVKLAKSPSVANFVPEAKAEMTIVEAGARRDMGQVDAALRTLELAPLTTKTRAPWVVRLRYAYADTLEEAGRLTDALAWFHRTHAIDSDEITDAADRAEALEKRIPQD